MDELLLLLQCTLALPTRFLDCVCGRGLLLLYITWSSPNVNWSDVRWPALDLRARPAASSNVSAVGCCSGTPLTLVDLQSFPFVSMLMTQCILVGGFSTRTALIKGFRLACSLWHCVHWSQQAHIGTHRERYTCMWRSFRCTINKRYFSTQWQYCQLLS